MWIKNIWMKFCLKIRGYAVSGSSLNKPCKIGAGSNIVSSTIGRYSYCGYDCWILYADIGSFCSIANNVKIGGASHPLSWVSTSPIFCAGKNVFGIHFANHQYDPYVRTHIGNDVWIGEGAIIRSGVVIGSGAVIGAGSVVTNTVGSYEVWVGNPAKMIRKRVDDECINKLLRSEWWLLGEKDLRTQALNFNDVQKFLDRRINNENSAY